MAYTGLKEIETKLGAEVNNQEAKDAQIKDAFRSYAQKGYNLIFGHGFEYYAPAAQVAKDFPDTVFVSSSGGGPAPANVGAFRFYLEQGFYLCGYMAGMMTKSGTVAMIGGDEVPSIKSTFQAFKAGAEAAEPLHHIACDFRFGRLELKFVDARQIEHVDRGAVENGAAEARRRGGAWKVRRLRTYTAQAVENRRLAGVRIPEENNRRCDRGSARSQFKRDGPRTHG